MGWESPVEAFTDMNSVYQGDSMSHDLKVQGGGELTHPR